MKTSTCIQVLAHLLFLFPGLAALAAEGTKIKDSESASHGAEDALHQVVDTYRFPGFDIVQFNLPVLSHYSYLLLSGPEAVLVDPNRDIKAYLDYAKKNNLTIKGVFLTHSHADFVAGHLETVRALQVPIHQNAASGARYKIEPLQEGSSFRVGQATVKVLATPGHTPDGMCGLVFAEGETQPRAVFTGDTLFVGSIGRPDLLEGAMSAATLASISFDTGRTIPRVRGEGKRDLLPSVKPKAEVVADILAAIREWRAPPNPGFKCFLFFP
jgi:hydroxyacylglutathione hydrolase